MVGRLLPANTGKDLWKMKKLICVLAALCLMFTAVMTSCAAAETAPLGFGILSGSDVAIRKTPGGARITRLRKNTTVWITESGTDSRGELWYHVKTQEVTGYSPRRNREGWIKAEFVSAGSALWHDVIAVAAAGYGLIALKRDGSVLCAGYDWNEDPAGRYEGLRDIRQVGTTVLGCEYFAVDGNGVYYSDGHTDQNSFRLVARGDYAKISKDNRLVNSEGEALNPDWKYPQNAAEVDISRVTAIENCEFKLLFLLDDGRVCSADLLEDVIDYPEPAWADWTDVADIASGVLRLSGGRCAPSFAAVRKDGTVLAVPEQLAGMIGSWQGMKKISIGSRWVLGLRQDGTVAAAAVDGRTPDVSGWTDSVDIGNGGTYCVGVRKDGTLVFAGDYDFGDDDPGNG